MRKAIYSSACSKATALMLHGLALPLVYRSLGPHQYALFVLLSGILSTMTLLQMGAGPGLTRELAQAHASDDSARESSLFGAALAVSISAAALGSIALLAVVRFVPAGTLFGSSFTADHAQVVGIATLCTGLLAIHVVLGVVDSTLAGYQEQVFTGVSTAIANILATIALYIVCTRASSIVAVIFVLYGLPVCSRFTNLILLLRRRPHLLRCFSNPRSMPVRTLMHTGAGFWAIQIAGIVEQNAGLFLLARMSTPQAVSIFAIAFKLTNYAGSAVSIVTQPLWPSFTDAIVRRDLDWVVKVFRNIKRGLLCAAVALALGWIILGRWVFETVFHVAVVPERILIVVFGLYLVANVWTHVHYISLMGIGDLWRIARIILAENCLVVICGTILVPGMGATGMVLSYLLASAALPLWALPRIVSNTVRQCCKEPISAGALS